MNYFILAAVAINPRVAALEQFLMGAVAMASAIVALFFLRFWRETADRLFGMFALSFLLLGITRLGLAVSPQGEEPQTHWYWMRLVAFLVILAAIVDKNRR
jgi:uncharacterized membrane protein HdeD (DUF308 family)